MELARTFGCVRKVWNLALDARTTAWYQRQQRVGYVQSSAMLTEWKRSKDLAFLAEVSSVPLQQTLRHLQGAFAAFFGKRARYPQFKSRKKSRGVGGVHPQRVPVAGRTVVPGEDGCAAGHPLVPAAARGRGTVDGHRVSRDAAGRWFVSLLCECPIDPLPPSGTTVGIDAGLTSLVTLSTGEKITNPRHEKRDRARFALAQRAPVPQDQRLREPGQGPGEGGPGPRPDHRPAARHAPQAHHPARP